MIPRIRLILSARESHPTLPQESKPSLWVPQASQRGSESSVGVGQGLTDALSSLHCSPVAHSSATGKECPASLLASPVGVGWDRRPRRQAYLGGASAWVRGAL